MQKTSAWRLLLNVLSAGCIGCFQLPANAQPLAAEPQADLSTPAPRALAEAWHQWLAALAGHDPAAALSHLRRAPAQFMVLADYHYWLGVYLQANHEPLSAAASEFELALLIDPNHAGAWYDYGLVQCRLGHEDSCQSILAEALRRFGAPEAAPLARPTDTSPWQGEVRLGLGYSSNYNQGSSSQIIPIQLGSDRLALELSPAYRPIAASYQRAELDLAYRSAERPQWELRASLLHRSPLQRNGALSDFAGVATDIIWHANPAHRFSFNLQSLHSSKLGSLDIQGLRWHHLQQDTEGTTTWTTAVERRRADSPQPGFHTLLAEVRRLGRYANNGTYYAALGAEHDLRHERSQGRLQFSAGLEQVGLLAWGGTARVHLRVADHRDTQAYSPLFGDTRRHNRQTDVTLSGRWPLSASVHLLAEVRSFHQHSSLALFRQSEEQLSLALGCRF